ncbi:MAG: AbrB/MazE/SpoVT family DNA-binding domain-containing protein [Desulfosarcina sp.]|nr:AbrB/MazE/SpoVT family DNA-binding domain-containing protein [Desulfobacterales bacterium]
MRHIAKLFMNGRSQAVRLPVDFRFECKEVFIRKDPVTDDIILSRKPGSWDNFFELMETIDVPEDFMADRDNELPPDPDLF